MMAYGHILKDELLEAAPCGCFNLHASLLRNIVVHPQSKPHWQWGKETGVTVMSGSPMDVGPIVDSVVSIQRRILVLV